MSEKRQRDELSVTDVTRRVKLLIENEKALGGIWVRGEASNVRLQSSGHLYFTLKDEHCQLNTAYFRFGRKRKPPADGDALLVHGDIRVYEPRGQYQLIADDLIKAGTGDLAARFEELKQRLHGEGLFAAELKAALPAVPRCVAVITSMSTAALQDVLNVLARRAPYLGVVLFPASVQGDAAPKEVIAALEAADACPGIDVILLVRGGGSLEDLWCFNDEKLARALAAIERPVITGVGHEVDYTIVDFIADQRVPTPSAAAEIVAPDVDELREGVVDLSSRLALSIEREVSVAEEGVIRLFDQRIVRDVLGALEAEEQNLDRLSENLAGCIANATMLDDADSLDTYLEQIFAPLAIQLESFEHRIPRLAEDLLHTGQRGLDAAVLQLGTAERMLTACDPRAPKKLGFAMVWREDGTLVRDPQQVASGEKLHVEVQQGEMDVERL